MAVGVVEMVDAACAGVLFTRDPARPGDAPSGDFVLTGHCVKLW